MHKNQNRPPNLKRKRKMINSSPATFFELLAVLFIGLKLGGIIDWSWWWVLSPIWGPIVIFTPIIIYLYKTYKKEEL